MEQLHQHQLSQSQKLDDGHEDDDSDGKTGAVQTPPQQRQQQRQQVSEAQQLEVPAITQTAPSPTEEKQERMAGLAGSNSSQVRGSHADENVAGRANVKDSLDTASSNAGSGAAHGTQPTASSTVEPAV